MSELSDFLLARIVEDEAAARDATPGPWRWDDDYRGPDGDQDADLALTNDDRAEVVGAYNWHCCDFRMAPTVNDADAAHIARWDPARVLAECDAKRRIVEIHDGWHICPDEDRDDDDDATEPPPCLTVRALALPYADHPDYRPEWRP